MDWLIQNLFSALVWEILLLLGVGAALGYLRAKWPTIAIPVLYGVAGAACVGILVFTFTGRGLVSKRSADVSPEHLEESIRKWADSAGLSVAKMPSVPQDVYFGLVVTLADGNPISVFRGKEKSNFIQMQCPLTLSQEHLAMLGKLTKEQADDAIEEVTLEMNRARIGFIMQTASVPPLPTQQVTTTRPSIFQQTILVTKPLAIQDAGEVSFIASINEIDSQIGIVRGVTDLTLKRYSRQAAITPPHLAAQ